MTRLPDAQTIRERIGRVMERIYDAGKRSGRNPEEIRLVLVTKTHPVETIQAAIVAGARYLGENYAEEAVGKIQAVREPHDLEWHMIGHVQSRKADLVCQHFHYLHSLDSLKLAIRLNRFLQEQGRILPALLECNTSGESTKYGWEIVREDQWGNLLAELREVVDLSNLKVQGLMTMAPFLESPEQARPFFNRLRRFQAFLKKNIPQISWTELSMGMSSDFEVAVEEGATWVRIGQAILGPRT